MSPKKKATSKPSAKKSTPVPFKEIKTWMDCLNQKIRVFHPALGQGPEPVGYHKAKVLGLDLTAGSVLVQIATPEIKGRYLLPLDTLVAKVK